MVEAAKDDAFDLGGQVGPMVCRRLTRRSVEAHREYFEVRRSSEWDLVRHEFVEDRAESPHVGSFVDITRRAHLFGGHVEERAHDVVSRPVQCFDTRNGELLGNAEIEHFDAMRSILRRGQKKVRRLDVPVDDACRVRLGQCLAGLKYEKDGHLDVDGYGARFALERCEVDTVQQFHGDVGGAGFEPADIEYLGNVFASQANGGACFQKKTLDGFGVTELFGMHEFNGVFFMQIEVQGGDDQAHTALAENLLDAIFTGKNVAGAYSRKRLVHRWYRGLAWLDGRIARKTNLVGAFDTAERYRPGRD